jgi:hypothetical protein
MAAYDRELCLWQRATGERIAGDPDPDVAWAGAALAARDDCGSGTRALAVTPPPPTTAGGRLMQLDYCDAVNDCSDTLARWRETDPGNLYVAALALEAGAPDVAQDLATATHYDDPYLDLTRIVTQITTRYDFTPPPAPTDYMPLTTSQMMREELLFSLIDTGRISTTLRGLVDHETLAPELRLKLADMLAAAEGSPYAVETAAELGIAAASAPADREHWCRLHLRAQNAAAATWELTRGDAPAALSTDYATLLRSRNAVDAVDAIVARLPANLRPHPVDEKMLEKCVASKASFDVDDEVDGNPDDADDDTAIDETAIVSSD